MPAHVRTAACLFVLVLAFAGCEASLDPFEETDLRFSIFGYLDVAADTQFVRVSELQESIFLGDDLDAVVELEEVGGTTRVVLQDSLLTFTSGARVHAPWTTAPIAPASTYRLTVTAPDGSTARATIETPAAVPTPFFLNGLSEASSADNPPNLQALQIRGAEKLADLRIDYVLAEPRTRVSVSYLDRARVDSSDGSFRVGFNAYADVQNQVAGNTSTFCPRLQGAELFIAATTPSWPDFPLIDLESLALPGTVSNVEGGLGFVGGVATTRQSLGSLVLVFSLNQAACLR